MKYRALPLVILACLIGCSTEQGPSATPDAGSTTPDASASPFDAPWANDVSPAQADVNVPVDSELDAAPTPDSSATAPDAHSSIDARDASSGTLGKPAQLPLESCGTCPQDYFRGETKCVNRVIAVAATSNRTCALHKGGRVSCWGGSGAFSRPDEVPDLADATSISVGGAWTACAVTAKVHAVCWGTRGSGSAGDGPGGPAQRLVPGPVLKQDGTPLTGVSRVTVGYGFGCASTSEGVYCWGNNSYGSLARPPGTSDVIHQVPGIMPPVYYSNFALPIPNVPSAQLAASNAYVMSGDGATSICGWGGNGTGHRLWPVTRMDWATPGCVSVTDVVEIAAGHYNACIRHGDGTLSCWGNDLGIREAPGGRTSFSGVTGVAAGLGHICALWQGRVSCWGYLQYGQLGDGKDHGTFLYDLIPQAVTGLPEGVVGIGSGPTADHTCAILADGSLRCWGRNAEGQLGDGNPQKAVNMSVPVKWW